MSNSKIHSRCGFYVCDGQLPDDVRDEIIHLCPGNGTSCNVPVHPHRYPLFYEWYKEQVDKLPEWLQYTLNKKFSIEVEWSW